MLPTKLIVFNLSRWNHINHRELREYIFSLISTEKFTLFQNEDLYGDESTAAAIVDRSSQPSLEVGFLETGFEVSSLFLLEKVPFIKTFR